MLMNHTRVPKVDRRIANVSLYDNCAICLFVCLFSVLSKQLEYITVGHKTVAI